MRDQKTAVNQESLVYSHDMMMRAPVMEAYSPVDDAIAQRGLSERMCNGMTIGLAGSIEGIAAVRPLWDQMQADEPFHIPNTDYDRYISVIQSIDGSVEPFAMYVRQGQTPLAMVIGRIEKHPYDLKLGYLTLLRPRLKCLNVVYGGIMGHPDERLCSVLIRELTAQLKAKRADVILFHHLRTDTAFYQAVRSVPGFLTRDHYPRADEHWRMDVPDTISKFYAARSRGHRHNLRRAISKFEEDHTGQVRYVHYSAEDEVDDFLKTAAGISAKTYQHALNAGLADDESTRSRIKASAANGWFRGHLIYAGDTPCAFQLGLQYRNVYYMINIGYDPAFLSYKPGLILFLKVLERLCDDPSVDTLDFYFGDAEYKNRYGTEHWQEASICLFAPRVYPRLINALQVTTTCMNAGLKSAIDKMGFVNQIKRKWRNRLRATAPNPQEKRSS
jgi:hypothetical protein